jgi:hypothetical protein
MKSLPGTPRLLLLQTYLLLLIIRLGLLCFGFGKVYKFITQVKAQNRYWSIPEMEEKIEQVNSVVSIASQYHFCRIQCLERSFALYYLLKREGIPVNLCIGVACFPLAFHCWIEYEGMVVNDPLPILKDKYIEMLRA